MLGISETMINRTENYSYGDYVFECEGTVIEPTLAGLYRYGLSEHGRCTGKVYIDTEVKHIGYADTGSEGVKHIGYVFLKRRKYDDCDDTYLCETWISMGEYIPATSERLEY